MHQLYKLSPLSMIAYLNKTYYYQTLYLNTQNVIIWYKKPAWQSKNWKKLEMIIIFSSDYRDFYFNINCSKYTIFKYCPQLVKFFPESEYIPMSWWTFIRFIYQCNMLWTWYHQQVLARYPSYSRQHQLLPYIADELFKHPWPINNLFFGRFILSAMSLRASMNLKTFRSFSSIQENFRLNTYKNPHLTKYSIKHFTSSEYNSYNWSKITWSHEFHANLCE